MISYYGSKANIADRYPKPEHDKIIECFAGAAWYSMLHFEKEILLVDKYEVLVNLWKWLQQCSPNDILKLPRFKEGQKVEDFIFDCEEQKTLVGFCIGYASTGPRKTATKRMTERPKVMDFTLKRIAGNLHKIKHWEIRLGSYEDIQNQSATWFIDPPYEFGGHAYRHNNNKIDFKSLSTWCKSRQGQIIVCENDRATWMDFKPFVQQSTLTGRTTEVIWLNDWSNFLVQKTIWQS